MNFSSLSCLDRPRALTRQESLPREKGDFFRLNSGFSGYLWTVRIRETGFPHECLHRESVRGLEKGVWGPHQAEAVLCIAPPHCLLTDAHRHHHQHPWSQKMYQSMVQVVITCGPGSNHVWLMPHLEQWDLPLSVFKENCRDFIGFTENMNSDFSPLFI